MKKTVSVAVCFVLISLLLGSCKAKEQPMNINNSPTVTFVNGAQEADIWLLSETPENLKTTLWGTADAAGVKTGESRAVPLGEAGDNGHYLFRMIDVDHFYYSANGITLHAGDTLRLKPGDNRNEFTLEVRNADGVLQETYKVFCARL